MITSLTKIKDNRELIPELFTSVESCYNLNYIFFGITNQDKIVHNTLPPEYLIHLKNLFILIEFF